jgi:hypothetical protein
MTIVSTQHLKSLEQWSATLFSVAGGLLVVHSAIHALIAFTSVSYPFHHEFPFGVVGMVLGFVALFGLYPSLVAHRRALARVGAVLAGLGTVGWIALGVRTLSEELGATPPTWLDSIAPLVIVGVILGYLIFGVVGFRTGTVSRTTALIVATPAFVMIFNITLAVSFPDFSAGPVIVATGFALAHLAIGVALRDEEFQPDGVDSAASMAT